MHTTLGTDGMILVMGVTGAGKSSFINTLKPNSVEVVHSTESSSQPPTAVQIFLDMDNSYSVTVVDTPGFDDTYRPDHEVLAEITEYLAAQYTLKIPLKGIIYLHQINENRMKGSGRQHLETFRSLCGDHALKNVIMVTTRWDTIKPGERGAAMVREQELIDKWWSPMIKHDASVAQWDGTRDTAEAMILELVRERDNVVLDIQRQVVDEGKDVKGTTAGLPFADRLAEDLKRYKQELFDVEEQLAKDPKPTPTEAKELKQQKSQIERIIKQVEKSRQSMGTKFGKRIRDKIFDADGNLNGNLKTGVQIFATILNITLSVVNYMGL